jgi:hypothetical protein
VQAYSLPVQTPAKEGQVNETCATIWIDYNIVEGAYTDMTLGRRVEFRYDGMGSTYIKRTPVSDVY